MKKLISLTLALLLCLSLGSFALADNEITLSNTSTSGTTEVSYTLTENNTYTVTIPATVSLTIAQDAENATGTLAVTASDVKIISGKALQVKAASTNSYKLKSNSSEIAYSAKLGENQIGADTLILNVAGVGLLAAATDNLSASITLEATKAAINGATVAGAHTDTITFTCSVETVTE